MFCALLTLPTPDPPNLSVEVPNQFEEKKLNKLLLVGSDKSGTSTIFKQVSGCLEKWVYGGYINEL